MDSPWVQRYLEAPNQIWEKKFVNPPRLWSRKTQAFDPLRLDLQPSQDRTVIDERSGLAPSSAIRTITLERKPSQPLGFAIRGGCEFGIGFHVSHVDLSSQADSKGLCIGDQILRVNGHSLDHCYHDDVLELITSRKTVSLTVKHIGRLPYRDPDSGGLVWKNVYGEDDSDSELPDDSVISFSDSTGLENVIEMKPDIKMVLSMPAGKSFGCSICTGTAQHSGIFIDSIRPGSLCSEVGLERGDQILRVNDVPFDEVTVAQAQYLLKSEEVLHLTIRKGGGRELFLLSGQQITEQKIKILKASAEERWKGKKMAVGKRVARLNHGFLDSVADGASGRGSVSSAELSSSVSKRSAQPSKEISAETRQHNEPGQTSSSNHTPQKKPAPLQRTPSYLGQKPVLLAHIRGSPQRVTPTMQFTDAQINGKSLALCRVPKDPNEPLGLEIEGGIGSTHNGCIIVQNVLPGGCVYKHGTIHRGDQLMMVNGSSLVDTTLGEARKLLIKAMQDHKEDIEFIIALENGRTD